MPDSTKSQPSRIYEFGQFRLNSDERLLTKNGEPIKLSAKVFDALLLLVENQGHLIGKDEMLDKLWEGVFVEEATLAKTISRLRKALGKENEYIETVAKSGYRFTEKVNVIEPIKRDTKVGENLTEDNKKTPVSNKRNLIFAAVAIIFITIAGLAIWQFYSKDEDKSNLVKSIAVLPFKSLNNSEDDKALELAMADAVITKLGKSDELTVLPTSTIFKYSQNENPNLENIINNLGVDAVLSGTFQKDGERLRVNVQLIGKSSKNPLWTEKFDSENTDIFALQDNISEQVANALKLELTGKRREQINKRYTQNKEAYDAYIKGRYIWNRRNPTEFKKSLELFEKAIELDPNYALAYTGIADCYLLFAEYRLMPANEGFAKARSAARKALELDDSLAEAHATLGYTLAFYDWNFEAAEKEFKRAIELDPNYTTAYQWYAEFLLVFGRFDEAKKMTDKAIRLAPTSPIIGTTLVGYHYTKGEYKKATSEAEKVIELDPNFGLIHSFKALTHLEKDEKDLGVKAWIRANKLYQTRTASELEELNSAWKSKGWKEFWQTWLKQIEKSPEKHLAWDRAITYIFLEDEEKAIKWLEKAVENRERWVLNMKTAPYYEKINSNQKFQQLVKKIGLESKN